MILRTPEERFRDLPGYSFAPHYADINGLRVHYVDEGQGQVILCLHGVLEWSYTYRKVIPVLARRSRVIAMDFIGFGRSDKFAERKKHSFQTHFSILSRFIDALALSRITLVASDWGAVVGLSLATERPDLFSRLVIMNTTLPTGESSLNLTFMLWRQFVELAPDLPIGRVIRMGMAHGYRMSPREIAGYEAPFPDARYKAGAVELPLSLPVRRNDPGAAEIRKTRDALSQWSKPALVMFSDEDPLFSKQYRFFRSLIPTAQDQPETVIRNAGHFLQEEKGEEIALHILDFIDRTPLDTHYNGSNVRPRGA
ncbi:MAG: haloalkane dehalogenase [Nitrospirae bacterium GWD2_57_9]|nr:MAG: haloalkane dehalogenase [Nitrospirae bacterium GWD2_57_9]OGW47842.1 MAG: haloalkane dehalogenase [Nitrospirae bacterium GWC2_57_9]